MRAEVTRKRVKCLRQHFPPLSEVDDESCAAPRGRPRREHAADVCTEYVAREQVGVGWGGLGVYAILRYFLDERS